MKVPSLIEILSEPTEQKGENTPFFIDEIIDAPKNVDHSLDVPTSFDTVEPQKVEPPKVDNSHFDNAPEPPKPQTEPVQVEKPKLSHSDNLTTATGIIAMYDILQTFTFPLIYKKSMFSKDEFRKLRDLKIRMRQDKETILSEEETILLDKFATFNDLRENVPFTETEIETIKEPLAKVLGKYNVQLGPEMLLLSALGIIALPRFMPMFSKLENL